MATAMRFELERRPLVIACAGLILGLTFSRQPWNLLFLLPLPWLVRSPSGRSIAAASIVLGAILSPGKPVPAILSPEYVDSEWKVVSLPRLASYGQRCEIERMGVRLVLTHTGDGASTIKPSLHPGAILQVKGVALPPVEGTEAYFESRRLVGRISGDAGSIRMVEDGPWLQRLGGLWRDEFIELAQRALPANYAYAAAALCFNVDGLLDDTTREQMRRTGTTHIIAASGLQVVVVAQGLLLLLMLLPIPRPMQLAVVTSVLALYAVATGLNPPVVRATIMWVIASSAYLVRREPDWLTALATSSIAYLLWKPGTIYDMGFQFSVAAVLFLALFGDRTKWRPGVEAWLTRSAKRTIRASVIAFLVVSPLIAYHFGTISIIAIPANLLVVVTVAPVVIAAMLALPVSMVSPAAGELVMKGVQPLVGYIDSVLNAFGGEYASLTVPPFSGYWLAPFYALVLMLWRPYVRQP